MHTKALAVIFDLKVEAVSDCLPAALICISMSFSHHNSVHGFRTLLVSGLISVCSPVFADHVLSTVTRETAYLARA